MTEEAKRTKYQWNADEYAIHSAPQQKWAKELIGKLKLIGNEWLLDIGSGDGKIAAEIASHLKNGKVVGIDNSEEMISLATKKFPATGYSNLSFQKQDAKALSFCQEFDIVFSNILSQPILIGNESGCIIIAWVIPSLIASFINFSA